MARTAQESRQYFVGIDGTQAGPFSEDQLADMIRKRTINEDTLVWYEGLGDWEELDTLAIYSEALGSVEKPSETSEPKSAIREVLEDGPDAESANQEDSSYSEEREEPDAQFTFAEGREAGNPVFTPEEGVFSSRFFQQKLMIAGALLSVAVVFIVGAAYFWSNRAVDIATITGKKIGPSAEEKRLILVRQILSELLIKPQEKLGQLAVVIKENPSDAAGKEGLQAALEYYPQVQQFEAAGDLLLAVKQPAEAAKYFLMDNPNYVKAEMALYQAYEMAQGAEAKNFLLENIRVLLGPIGNLDLSVQRIKLFESKFPGESHPYGYYLKSTEARVADLFSRLSFFYVQKLMAYLVQELPQVALLERPLVEIKREKNGMYRIIGKYSGPVGLNSERLPNVNFLFWLRGENWSIVETNLTPEREKFAKAERRAAAKELLTDAALLAQIENVFRQQFPKKALHETVQ